MAQFAPPTSSKGLIKNAFRDLLAMHELLENGCATLSERDLAYLQVATECLASIVYPALDGDAINRIHVQAEPELKKLREQGEEV